MSKIGILGTGSWATALGRVLHDNGHQVLLYGIDQNQIDDINMNHQNSQFFGDVVFEEGIKATNDLKETIKDAQYLLITIPTQFVKDTLKLVKPLLDKKITIINASKGFDLGTNMRMSDTIRSVLSEDEIEPVVSLIGPSHAEEVAIRMLTAVCSVSLNKECAKKVQRLFSNEYFRVYTMSDEIGAEYGVAMKNVIAVAAGVLSGLGYGDNSRAALITRGLSEMVRYGVKKGGKFETYLGLTGVGDLIVTCSSVHSRNFQAGLEIGKTNDAKTFMKNNKKTCEGIRTCRVIYEDQKQYDDIEMPITEAIYQVLYEGKEPKEEIKKLMLRELKPEQ
ncbi:MULTISPECIES: NAD(P)H-dependent glycerol-3-phosphate dehydrogenase [Coprobacillaceae]|uniref:NAD(P)H-dependent glycerol-3-phosphate dehydrogenase n=1 Tax=Coprobacillaceae TaxID=2810280 RepID=UPI000E4827A6|nr:MULTISPECIES: NAD(P)H-dependent glycerol-3-phosphate dehydrogenase [Coprobacillaceae]RHM60629.1 NAD(P)-dependent glycerol-3-phosphate dehydrogenase [Coprobacillus sp. AF33-1AC]RHS93326.1 NAD(P)-dependent glycerol-3-phosphate dehydrogenase [Erysipelatoclostridium sp. AM42-17]